MVTVSQVAQTVFVHLTYLLYSGLWVVAEESNVNKTGTILAVAVWSGNKCQADNIWFKRKLSTAWDRAHAKYSEKMTFLNP